MLIHETPDWLLETCRFEKAIEALKFYKTDPKLLMYEDRRRKSITGEELSYSELVEMYREESEKEKSTYDTPHGQTFVSSWT